MKKRSFYEKMLGKMDSRFKDIKVIAWDVDTTLYKAIPELSIKLKEEFIQQVAKVKNLSITDAREVFETERAKWGSSTMTLRKLGAGNEQDILKIQKKINKTAYIMPDPQLLEMFKILKSFRHFLITNSTKEDDRATLVKLGLPETIFEKIITVEETGEPKPSLKPFEFLLNITGLPAQEHVYVGDMDKVDIEPAKKLGMKTIMVWGESKIADLSLSTVYDIANVLT